MQKPRVLVADSDQSFLDKLLNESGQVEIVATQDQRAAQLAIADSRAQLSAICLNVNLCSPKAVPLIRFVKCHRPSSPLFLLNEPDSGAMDKEELERLHVHGMIQKPVSPQQLIQTLVPGSCFNLSEALVVAQGEATKTGETKQADDTSMHPIAARSFLCGQKSFFDVFVRLGSGRFVMILKAGDQFEPERLMQYLNRGVQEFYIKKEAQLYYLQYCDKLTGAIVASDKIGNETKIAQVMNLGNETFEFLKSHGLSESSLSMATSFVKQANALVKRKGLDKLSEIQAFLGQVELADHGTSVVMVTSLMIDAMGFKDDKVTALIAAGAFLHDIGMLGLPEAIRAKEESEDSLEPAERELYETHPKLGAELLQKVAHINPLLPQIALQHHERRTRKGFPYKLGPGAISTAAEMVGLAEVFLKVAMDPMAGDPMESVRRYHADEFSLKIVDGLLKAFKK